MVEEVINDELTDECESETPESESDVLDAFEDLESTKD